MTTLTDCVPQLLDDADQGVDLERLLDPLTIHQLTARLEYVAPAPDLLCPICQLPFDVPTTTLCGHTYCRACLELALNELLPKCPMDRTPLDPTNINDVFPAPLIINGLVGNLSLRCLNRRRGCQWEGKHNEVVQHLRDCGYTRVRCNGVKSDGAVCPILTEQRYLKGEATHVCAHRPYTCLYCHAEMSEIAKETHLREVCEEFLQKCAACDTFLPLKEHAAHALQCELTQFRCLGREFGCEWEGGVSKELTEHMLACSLNKLANSPAMVSQRSRIERLERDNLRLSGTTNTIVSAVVSGKLSQGLLEMEEIGGTPSLPSVLPSEIDWVRGEFEQMRLVPGQMMEALMALGQLRGENLVLRGELDGLRSEMEVLRRVCGRMRREMLVGCPPGSMTRPPVNSPAPSFSSVDPPRSTTPLATHTPSSFYSSSDDDGDSRIRKL